MSPTRTSESGFTLAGLIVLLTIISIVVAYTVPRMWSITMARERDQETLFAMKQYARGIRAFQDKNHTVPTSLDQLKQARNPRFMRGNGELIDPLTGKVDWVVIPATQPGQTPQSNAPLPPGIMPNQTGPRPVTSVPVNPQQQAGQPGGFVGPIGGVRPNKTGTSYIVLNGTDSYEQWSYTTADLDAEINQHRNAIMVK